MNITVDSLTTGLTTCMQRFILVYRHRLSPLLAVISVVLLMVSNLSHQFLQWNALLTDPSRIAPAGSSSNRKAVDLKQIAELFKPDTVATDLALRNTNLPLTLLGSFVHSRGEQSVAVIQVSGKAPQRLVPGKVVIQGVRLQAVNPDHVVLLRDSGSERLFFPRHAALQPTPVGASLGAAYKAFHAEQLKKLPGVATSESQKRVKALLRSIRPPEGTALDQQ